MGDTSHILTEIFKQTDPVEQIVVFNKLTTSKTESHSLDKMMELLRQYYMGCCLNTDFGFVILEWIMGLCDSNRYNNSNDQYDLLLETVLTESCRLNNIRLSKYLITFGVRNNIENQNLKRNCGAGLNSSTALLYCIDHYNLDLVKQMNEANIKDDSALIRSLCLGKHSIAEYLMQNGYTFPKKIEYEMLKNSYVFFSNRDWKATTSLAEATARANDVDILSILYTKESERNPSYMPVFIFDNMKLASMLNNVEVVKWLDEKLDEHKIPELSVEISILDCIKNASRKNAVAVVDYLIPKYPVLAKKNAEAIKHEAMRNSYTELEKKLDAMLKTL